MHGFSRWLLPWWHLPLLCKLCIFHLTPCSNPLSKHDQASSSHIEDMSPNMHESLVLESGDGSSAATFLGTQLVWIYGSLLLWLMITVIVWHFLSDTRKGLTHSLLCCCGAFSSISWTFFLYVEFSRELTAVWCMSCCAAKEAQKSPFVNPNAHRYGLGTLLSRSFTIV